MNAYELPFWLQTELATQAPVGDRNNHCMRIAPAMLRHGMTADEALRELLALYPLARGGELEGVVNRAATYAESETEFDPYWQAKQAAREEVRREAEGDLPAIFRDWQMEDIVSDAPDLPLPEQRKLFIREMFQLEDILWIGGKYSSGPKFKNCFRAAHEWHSQEMISGEFISHSTFKQGTVNRSQEFIAERRYLVLESDTLHPSDLASVARYIRDYHELALRAIVTTGGVRHTPAPGLHFWFDYPGDDHIDDWEAVLQGYGADTSTLRGPQPVRLPGCVRRDTDLLQELLWIDLDKPKKLG